MSLASALQPAGSAAVVAPAAVAAATHRYSLGQRFRPNWPFSVRVGKIPIECLLCIFCQVVQLHVPRSPSVISDFIPPLAHLRRSRACSAAWTHPTRNFATVDRQPAVAGDDVSPEAGVITSPWNDEDEVGRSRGQDQGQAQAQGIGVRALHQPGCNLNPLTACPHYGSAHASRSQGSGVGQSR